jgi:hypothetical protein
MGVTIVLGSQWGDEGGECVLSRLFRGLGYMLTAIFGGKRKGEDYGYACAAGYALLPCRWRPQ